MEESGPKIDADQKSQRPRALSTPWLPSRDRARVGARSWSLQCKIRPAAGSASLLDLLETVCISVPAPTDGEDCLKHCFAKDSEACPGSKERVW